MPRLLLLATLLACLPLPAAPPRVLAWDATIAARKLALARGSQLIEFEGLHPSKRSEPIPLKGDGPVFLRALDRTDSEGKPAARECPPLDNLRHPLLLIMADEKHPTGLRIVAFEDDPAAFRWGTFRFINATPKALALRLEDQSIRLASGWKTTEIRLDGDPRGIGTMIAALDALQKPLYSAVWEHDPETRTLCFIVPGTDPRLGPIEIKAIPETRISFELNQSELRDR